MYNFSKIVLIMVFAVLILNGCGSKVEVPPAHIGKILTKNGFSPEVVAPSKFRLPVCMAYCDKLIVLETSDRGFKESMKLFMPKDKLNLNIDVRGTLSVPNDSKTVNALFERVTAVDDLITADRIYNIYGQQAVRGIIRSELVKYTIGDILQNRDNISSSIHQTINKKLKASNTPLIISRFELADIQPPAVIVKAQESAKKREIAIQKEEANAKVAMVKAERALDVAKKQRLVEREKALGIAEQNEIAAKSITPQLLKYRQLEVSENVLKAFAESGNGNIIVIPVDMSSLNTASDSAVFGKVLGKSLNKNIK